VKPNRPKSFAWHEQTQQSYLANAGYYLQSRIHDRPNL
jgi:hypothetical protein